MGAHLPIGKGLKHTADEAVRLGLDALQVFLRNPRGRGARQLSQGEVDYFKKALKDNAIDPLVVHIPYICNPAAVKDDLYQFALETVQQDLERCALVGADFLVLHPGSYTTSTVEAGIERVSKLLNKALENYSGDTMILLETMAGQGSELGSNLDELVNIINGVKRSECLGVCLDTCHTFAAGWDWTRSEEIPDLMAAIDQVIGRDRIKVIHANDSEKELGSRRDRHAPIGQGMIGEQGFAGMFRNPFLGALPFILETPFETVDEDIKTLKRIRQEAG
ncbi:deoxyribonuclease IV [Syntrophomonas erecta subsp. sporosyntropha]